VKTGLVVQGNLDMIALVLHAFSCFAGTMKFKQNNTSKPEICLHQIGGDC